MGKRFAWLASLRPRGSRVCQVVSFVSSTSIAWMLLPMVGERHVFDPLLAAILNQRERHGVLASAVKLIDAWAAAE
jgi:hypothetical protein